MEKATGRTAEKDKKDLTAAFNELSLKITATENQKIVNFLDIKLNLHEATYQSYEKPNRMTPYTSTATQTIHHRSSSNYPNQ